MLKHLAVKATCRCAFEQYQKAVNCFKSQRFTRWSFFSHYGSLHLQCKLMLKDRDPCARSAVERNSFLGPSLGPKPKKRSRMKLLLQMHLESAVYHLNLFLWEHVSLCLLGLVSAGGMSLQCNCWLVRTCEPEKSVVDLSSFIFSAKEKDRKQSLDPLNEMKKYLDIKKSHKEDKGKKHKIVAGKDSNRQKQSIEEMRRERLRREQEEHEKERKLLAKFGKEKHSSAIERSNYDGSQR